MEFTNQLPTKTLRRAYFRFVTGVISFYRDPYKELEDNRRRVHVIGAFLKRDENNENDTLFPKFEILIDDKHLSNTGARGRSGDQWNLRYFCARADNLYDFPPDPKKVTVSWWWEDTGRSSETFSLAGMKTHTYGYFHKMPDNYEKLNPEPVASELVFGFNKEKKGIEDMVSSRIKDFPWDNLAWSKGRNFAIFSPANNYVGNHKGFQHVFSVTLYYQLSKYPKEEMDGEQVFYLIEEKGKWKAIDVTPFSEMGDG